MPVSLKREKTEMKEREEEEKEIWQWQLFIDLFLEMRGIKSYAPRGHKLDTRML